MDYYLLDHPNTIPQYRHPRRAPLSGMVGVHTAEGAMDTVGMDTGAENVAAFIANRPDYGSYHCIVDSDSAIAMAPDDYETWHIAADLHNWHSWGISAACRTVDWDPESAWTQATIARMGAEICAFWARHDFPVETLAGRWLTRDQALAHQPGLVEHGVVQPGDRTDAWATRPDRDVLRRMLTDAILHAPCDHPPSLPTPTPEDDDMPRPCYTAPNGEIWWETAPGRLAYIDDPGVVQVLRTKLQLERTATVLSWGTLANLIKATNGVAAYNEFITTRKLDQPPHNFARA